MLLQVLQPFAISTTSTAASSSSSQRRVQAHSGVDHVVVTAGGSIKLKEVGGGGVWAHEGADIPLPSPPEETPPGGQHADSWGPLGPANWLAAAAAAAAAPAAGPAPAGVWQGPCLGLPTLEAMGVTTGGQHAFSTMGTKPSSRKGGSAGCNSFLLLFLFFKSPTTGSELLFSPGAAGRSLWQVARWLKSIPEGEASAENHKQDVFRKSAGRIPLAAIREHPRREPVSSFSQSLALQLKEKVGPAGRWRALQAMPS